MSFKGIAIQLALFAGCLWVVYIAANFSMTKLGGHLHGAETHAHRYIGINEIDAKLIGCQAIPDDDGDRYRCDFRLTDKSIPKSETKFSLYCDGYFKGDGICTKPDSEWEKISDEISSRILDGIPDSLLTRFLNWIT